MTTPHFGELLRRFRIDAGLSQEELAERAGVSVQAVGALERGDRRMPRRDTINRLAEALSLSPEASAALRASVPRGRGPAAQASAPAAAARTNLSAPATSFVGRTAELAVVRGLLDESRLLTLAGAGGVGKTRLALHVASGQGEHFPDGVWLAELAALDDGDLVARTVATLLGVREEPGRPLIATLTDQLIDRALLLVLDNCEHLLDACAELAAALLRHCPRLRILVTSRQSLGIPGETTYRVPPLAVPEAPGMQPSVADLDRLAGTEAVRLFVERARQFMPAFALNARDGPVVAQICRLLDGIPLAIELAAARIASLSVEQVAARLDDRFRLLTGGSRLALPRHQTLRAAVDWSHDLLTEPERVLFRRLAVFKGGCDIDAVEAVCAGDDSPPSDALDLTERLIDKSLVLRDDGEGPARYRLLETIRQYAWEKLDQSGETPVVRERHLTWYMSLALRAEPELIAAQQAAWHARLDADVDNLRAAMDWAHHGGSLDAGLRLAGALWRYWWSRGLFTEARGWLERLRRPAVVWDEDLPGYVTATYAEGALAFAQGDMRRGAVLWQEALGLWRERHDDEGVATALNALGHIAVADGDDERAVALFEQSAAIRRGRGDVYGLGAVLNNLGEVAQRRGRYREAEDLYRECLALYRTIGADHAIVVTLENLAYMAIEQGDDGRATELAEESLALRRGMGQGADLASALRLMGRIALRQDDLPRATALIAEALDLERAAGRTQEIARILAEQAVILRRQGEEEQASAQLEEAAALYREIGSQRELAGVLRILVELACSRDAFAIAERYRTELRALGEASDAAAGDSGNADP
jgi:non-specific serine/threonine protein kinase